MKKVLALLVIVSIFLFGVTMGRWEERRCLVHTIRTAQEENPTKVIRFERMKLTIIPFGKGMIVWDNY